MKDLTNPDQIKFSAAANLIKQVLIMAYTDYKNSLLTIKEYRTVFPKIKKIVMRYDEYIVTKKIVEKIIKKEKKTDKDIKTIKKYKELKNNIKVPEKFEKEIFRKVLAAIHTKVEIELFYKSRLFSVYTLGSDITGDEVIETIKKDINWKEKYNIC